MKRYVILAQPIGHEPGELAGFPSEVGTGYKDWNAAIHAGIGEIVPCPDMEAISILLSEVMPGDSAGEQASLMADRFKEAIDNGEAPSLWLWVDEEGRLDGDPKPNALASAMARLPIYGNAIVFYPGDLT